MRTLSLTELFRFKLFPLVHHFGQSDISKGRSECLKRLFQTAPVLPISDEDRQVIFSDLHLGNGSNKDDFLSNADFFKTILEHYYLANGYQLILNGDIEELQRFQLKDIISRWHEVYRLFQRFKEQNALFKITGNDDLLFIFHGHQASIFIERFNYLTRFVLRYIANPCWIKNYSFSHDSRARFRTERQVYYFSRDQKILSLIGHTHRPLFESFSKADYLKSKVEQLCREYSRTAPEAQVKLAAKIKLYNNELQQHLIRNKQDALKSSLYDANLLVPCLFSSGCVIGKNGITAIEIAGGSISLVYWFDRHRSQKYFEFNGYKPKPLNNGDHFRLVLNEDNLKYIFTRIKLLA